MGGAKSGFYSMLPLTREMRKPVLQACRHPVPAAPPKSALDKNNNQII
jgi:hypothetical protein